MLGPSDYITKWKTTNAYTDNFMHMLTIFTNTDMQVHTEAFKYSNTYTHRSIALNAHAALLRDVD